MQPHESETRHFCSFFIDSHIKVGWQSLLVIIEIWNHEINSCVAVDSMYTQSPLTFFFSVRWSMLLPIRVYSVRESLVERIFHQVERVSDRETILWEKKEFQYFYMQNQSKSQWKYWFFSTKYKLNKWKCFTDLFIFRIFPLHRKKVWTFHHSVNSMHTKKLWLLLKDYRVRYFEAINYALI